MMNAKLDFFERVNTKKCIKCIDFVENIRKNSKNKGFYGKNYCCFCLKWSKTFFRCLT